MKINISIVFWVVSEPICKSCQKWCFLLPPCQLLNGKKMNYWGEHMFDIYFTCKKKQQIVTLKIRKLESRWLKSLLLSIEIDGEFLKNTNWKATKLQWICFLIRLPFWSWKWNKNRIVYIANGRPSEMTAFFGFLD